jgi:hypothetical protein
VVFAYVLTIYLRPRAVLTMLHNFILLQQCTLEVKVFVAEPLLTAAQVLESNLLKVTLEAAYSIPDSFIPVGPQQNYMVGLQVPSVGEVKLYCHIFM